MSLPERDGSGVLETPPREAESAASTSRRAPSPGKGTSPGSGPVWSYDEALRYLKSRERFGVKFGLENIGKLVEALGNPERTYESALVAGTNGKGSVAALLESILRASGLRTGRYTSPHIRFLEERIAINGETLDRDALTRSVLRVAEAARALWPEPEPGPGGIGGAESGHAAGPSGTSPSLDSSAPTFFEATTAGAFLAFASAAIDFAVLEVGMGGRYDATNVAPARVSIINPIGFDHERFLGTTLPQIASEKAAIIKQGCPVIVGRLAPEARTVVWEEAAAKSATVHEATEDVVVGSRSTPAGHEVTVRTAERDYGSFHLPLAGRHQLDNLAVAVRAAEVIVGPSLEIDSVRRGVAATRWPGRLERIEGQPSFLLDAAHNVMAAEALSAYLGDHPVPHRVLLFGVMKDKRVFEILERLLPHVSYVVATRPRMSRSRPPEALSRWTAERGKPSVAIRSTEAALARARALAGPDGEVLVAGSIFLLGEVVAALDAPADGETAR